MRFKGFLNEKQKYSDVRGKEISEDEAIDLIKKNCKKIVNIYKKNIGYIYRGSKHRVKSGCIINDPTKGEPRKSANTKNWFTLLIDNLPSWKDYPKRSRSIVCTTDIRKTLPYGQTFIVFPYDNAKIGVCPREDIWFAFDDKNYVYVPAIINFIEWIGSIADIYNIEQYDYLKFKKDLDDISNFFNNVNIDEFSEKIPNFEYQDKVFVHYINKYFGKLNFIDFFNEMLDPSYNNFNWIKPNGISLTLKKKVEVWVGNAPSILMSYDTHMPQLMEKL